METKLIDIHNKVYEKSKLTEEEIKRKELTYEDFLLNPVSHKEEVLITFTKLYRCLLSANIEMTESEVIDACIELLQNIGVYKFTKPIKKDSE